ncbi:SMP-30/gluconolactonase/LRE family protein [Cupriavidus consociatus]|uniref:SMP-30/gluconolactonase/LRE family protein n=1 Tax=Cupriavidus consociatus TaxID=2821357 RepID=UPI001AE6FA95|nr:MULTISPECIES: SMP-30/gluconolactonase/LRE family protein [unclassified Cupriavidus]MBP0619031.1 SMP-30/gluconolactonase/LRE family protein [Cupriavidus sp. LEh25]MDK2655677.1 SMP-30/gluconolactonase/LRE family protein [Cupriavidus sp. LEh21]
MFLLNSPVIREAVSFSSLPARYRHARRSEWSRANQGGREIDSFLEGPVVDDAGNLYVADIPNGRIFRIDRKGDWDVVAEWNGEPNGMKLLDPGSLLVTDYRNGLMQVDLRDGSVRPYLPRRNTESFKGVNDLTLDSRGNVYFTDQGQTGLHDPSGRVYRLTPEGRLELLLANVPSPNGIVLSPDERFLFVAVTRGNCVWRMPLQEDGSVSKAGQFFTSYGPSGPDGLAMDVDGRLLVANPGLAYVWVLNHRAEPVEVIRGTPGHSLTNVAFGGEDRTTLYVTDSSAGEILQVGMSVPGVRPPYLAK